jgi:hypothetical protein
MKLMLALFFFSLAAYAGDATSADETVNPAPPPASEHVPIGEMLLNSHIGSNAGEYDGDRFRCEDRCANSWRHHSCMATCLNEVGREYHGE